jgi:hypothetical protein
MNKNVSLWGPFLVASVLTVVVYITAWAISGYWILLSCLGVISVFLGARVLRGTGLKLWPTVGVAIALVVGQWWFIAAAGAFVIWKIGGFAP